MYFQAHTACYKQLPVECSFGCLRQIMVPPYAVSVPRMDIAQEDLVRMPRKQGKCLQNYGQIQWQIQDFSEVGAPAHDYAKFSLMLAAGGGHILCAPPFRSASEISHTP